MAVKTMKSLLCSFHLLVYVFVACPSRIFAEFLSVICNLVNSMLARIYLVKLILDYVILKDLQTALWLVLFAALLDFGCSAYENWMNEYYRRISNIKIHQFFQEKLYKKSVEVDVSSFDDPEFYNQFILAAQNSDSMAIKFLNTVNNFVVMLFQILITGGLVIHDMKYLLLVAIIPATLYGVISGKNSKVRSDMTLASSPIERKQDYVKRIFFLKQYAMDIRSTTVKNLLTDMYDNSMKNLLSTIIPFAKKRAVLYFFSGMLFYMQYFSIIVILSWRALVQRDLSVGDFSLLLASTIILNNNWRFFGGCFGEMVEYGIFTDRYRKFLTFANVSIRKNDTALPEKVKDIALYNVSFQYDERKILNSISISIKMGKKIAIVGPNGVGKSTLIHLILKLYSPKSGTILLNGSNIELYKTEAYRDTYSLILQDYHLYPFTIAENILLKIPENKADEILVLNLLEKVGLADKVKMLPNGIHTYVTKEFTDDGVVLSGGERQRMAIARAIAQNAPVLIMDEPTSALDPEMESEINKLIVQLLSDKTIIIISHRLSTIAGLDYIYLLDHSGIEEQGTHEELMNLDGHYARIYHMQTKIYSMNE